MAEDFQGGCRWRRADNIWKYRPENVSMLSYYLKINKKKNIIAKSSFTSEFSLKL